MKQHFPVIGITSAQGCELVTEDGKRLVDGTSSWWACVHGYNHPELINAIEKQLHQLPHIMFGGITHQPAIELAKRLVDMTCPELTKVFFADSGSIAVEVALKMSLQYWQGKNQPEKQKIVTIKRGYHGDTFAAMSVCDPDNGMHTMFGTSVVKQFFAPAPETLFNDANVDQDLNNLKQVSITIIMKLQPLFSSLLCKAQVACTSIVLNTLKVSEDCVMNMTSY